MEGIILENYSIGYRDIPKTACTSIKEMLYYLDNEEMFKYEKYGKHIHNYYGKKRTEIHGAEFRFVVVRDPIKRFLSAYSNRVRHHKELSKQYLERQRSSIVKKILRDSIIFNPGLGQFLEFFDMYYMVPSIKHHCRPIIEILTEGLTPFNRIYRFEELEKLQNDLAEFTKKNITIPHSQTGGKKYSIKDLNSAQLDQLIEFYRKDYELLKDFYTVDKLYKQWRRGWG